MNMDRSPVAQFHMVVRGQCWLHTASLPEPMPLVGGDVVVFPHGDAHWLANSPHEAQTAGQAVLQAHQNGRPLFQDGTVCTTLVCGHFAFDRDLHHPLLPALPPFIHLQGSRPHDSSWLDTAVSLIIREVGMSHSAFAGRFKAVVGLTPMRYITCRRLQKARELLRDTNLPLTIVALQVGYQSQAAFIRAFQREFNQNPGAMRKALYTKA